MDQQMQQRVESLGPAEQAIQAIINFSDHLHHGRSGIVTPDQRHTIGARWEPAQVIEENGQRIVYRISRQGKKTVKTRIGVLRADERKIEGSPSEFRKPGFYEEACTWIYRQIAQVYKLDHEFAARWASWAFKRGHQDAKVALAAFMLLQEHSGLPIKDLATGEVAFFDHDYRAVGEAMCLIPPVRDTKSGGASGKKKGYGAKGKGKATAMIDPASGTAPSKGRTAEVEDPALSPKEVLRVGKFLQLPEIAQINREMGFGTAVRRAPLGRYEGTVRKWLRFREENPAMLSGLVRSAYSGTVRSLASISGYKPKSPKFFDDLRWKQKQSTLGHRTLNIGKEVAPAESWKDLTEEQICEKIATGAYNFKRVEGMLPSSIGLTRAIMAAAICTRGVLSDADMLIKTHTIEGLGLLDVPRVKERWTAATQKADNQRAANLALRVKSEVAKQGLQDAADTALRKEVERVIKDMRVYFCIDISGSMQDALPAAKQLLAKFLQGFPVDRTHVSVFQSTGSIVEIPLDRRTKQPTAQTIEVALSRFTAGGGTLYSQGVVPLLTRHPPLADEDLVIIFIGDQDPDNRRDERLVQIFSGQGAMAITPPLAFGLLEVTTGGRRGEAVEYAARCLQIPMFRIKPEIFEDAYAPGRILSDLINSATVPVGGASISRAPDKKKVSLAQQILETPLLDKPLWA